MSDMCIPELMARIKAATPESPIAVFKCGKPDHLEAVFANTVGARQRARGDGRYVGQYCRDDDLDDVELGLRKLVREERWKLLASPEQGAAGFG